MEKFKLTKEQVANAKTYIPLSRKTAIAYAVADACVEAAELGEQEKSMGLSPIYKENNQQKAMLLLTVFLTEYFGVEMPEEMTSEVYDRYASAHIMNCLERMKADAALKDRIFDILYDYKELKRIVDSEIYQEKMRRNDPIDRLLENMTVVSSPAAMKEKSEELKKIVEAAQKEREERKAKGE